MNVSSWDWSCSLVSSASPKLDSYTRAEYTDWRSMALVRSLYSAEASTENAERWAIFEEEQLQAGCGGNHTQTAGYKSTA